MRLEQMSGNRIIATDGRSRLVSSEVSPSGWHFSGNRDAVP